MGTICEDVIVVEILDDVIQVSIEEGLPGPKGDVGDPATINGVNTLTMLAGDNITLDQAGDVLTISAFEATYVHDQIASLSVWTIVHNMDKYPSVMVVDSGNSVVVGEITYVSKNEIMITFIGEFSGKAYLN